MTLNNNGCIDSFACNSEHDLNPTKTDENEIDLADQIIRNAMTKIKIGCQQKASKAKRKHKFPCTVCEKDCNVNQQSVYYTQLMLKLGT